MGPPNELGRPLEHIVSRYNAPANVHPKWYSAIPDFTQVGGWQMTKPFQYQRQESGLTLKEGLAEYYEGHPSLFPPSQLAKDSARFFRSHDIAHVVFGLDTTLADEALADAWTLLGTDVGLRRYVRYLRTNPEAQQLMKQIGWARTALISLRVLPQLFIVWLHTKKMTSKWPWEFNEGFMDLPLQEIRRRFNIRLTKSYVQAPQLAPLQ